MSLYIVYITIVLTIFVGYSLNKGLSTVDLSNISIIKSDSTNTYSAIEIYEHNNTILDILQVREEQDTTSMLSAIDRIWLLRSFFITITGILITFFFSKEPPERTTYKFYFFLVTIFFAIDVHMNDAYKISCQYKEITSHTIDRIANTDIANQKYWKIDYKLRDNKIEDAGTFYNRISRKFFAALKPDIIQIAIYILPFCVILWLKKAHSK